MRPSDVERAQVLDQALIHFARDIHPLPGFRDSRYRESFVEQLIESLRRIEYVYLLDQKQHAPQRADPSTELFDPLCAAILAKRTGDLDEACWLTFLSVNCGKHLRVGWRLTRLIYGGLGRNWSWNKVSARPTAFRQWLERNHDRFRPDNRYGFSNHRKYETLNPDSNRSMGKVVESYVRWVRSHEDHAGLFREADSRSGGNSHLAFDYLYQSLNAVISFGRMAKFDYLTMLSKLGLVVIEPGIPYMQGATGPTHGARLLFGGNFKTRISAHRLDQLTTQLGNHLGVGMQAMEDAICNWQKSPARFRPFRG